MWSGTVANIPTGWALCNGSNSTPDLRNRFIVGASVATGNYAWDAQTGAVTGNYAPGNTGGEAAHQLTIAELASHTHTYNGGNLKSLAGDGAGADDYANGANLNTGSRGEDDYHENRPPYYALAFIMRTV